MKIKELDIRNFRALEGERITFNDYTCLVGPNGSGKSTVLTALRILFRDSMGGDLLTLKEDDFHLRNTNLPIKITIKFCDLETEAQKDFAHYYRHGLLIVSAIAKWDSGSRSAEIKQFGERMAIEQFSAFFRAEEASISELKSIYDGIRESFSQLPSVGTKAGMREALRAYEAGHPELCKPILSEDQFYGFSKGTNLLQKYVQWVCVPAVKDATTEQLEARNNALKVLLERTVRSRLSFKEPLDRLRRATEIRYREILADNQKALESLSNSLNSKLKDWAHPDARLKVKWHDDSSKYVNVNEPLAQFVAGEGQFEGALSSFGHGLQRSFLLALLQELSGATNTTFPRLILACEEPELYQHPPQAKHLASVLEKLSISNTQVMVSTHSPYFISGRGFEDVRLFRPNPALRESNIHCLTMTDLSTEIGKVRGEPPVAAAGLSLRVEQALTTSLNEMFFASTVVFVEGPEDAAYITSYLTLTENWEDFRRLGCHIVPTSGKASMIQPLAIAKMVGIPAFTVIDADSNEDDVDTRAQHARNNSAILRLCGVGEPDPFPAATVMGQNFCMWSTQIGPAVRSEIGEQEWANAVTRVRESLKIDAHNLQKNPCFLGHVLTNAWEHGTRCLQMQKLCSAILEFADHARQSRSLGTSEAVSG